MGDSGEGLVDAEARFQERQAEREQERARREGKVGTGDAERDRAIRSLTLAKTELERQAQNTQNPIRLEQIKEALRELERRLQEALAPPKR
jgi:hypothetical protein